MEKKFVFLISFFLVACTSQQTPLPPTKIPTSTPLQPTLTPAPKTFQWDALPVLIQLYVGAPYVEGDDAWSVMPKLVIYADGHVIFSSDEPNEVGLYAWHNNLKIAHLPPNEICSLLTKIDASGFFNFNQDDYIAPDMTDGGSTTIIVQAWRSHSVRAYEIQSAENLQPALKEPYSLLSTYQPPNAVPYYPDQVVLSIISNGDFEPLLMRKESVPWPEYLTPIENLPPILDAGDRKRVVLSGQDAAGAYRFFKDETWKLVNHHDKLHLIIMRPVFPGEIAKSMWGWRPASFEESPKVKLTCSLP